MRRKDREITDLDRIQDIIASCDVCRLALHDEEYPYIVPLNFGFERQGDAFVLYFHCARVGKKLDLLRKNNRVSFEMDTARKLIDGPEACDYTMEFESVIGTGTAELVQGEDKLHGLRLLMKQYVPDDREWTFGEKMVQAVEVIRLVCQNVTGKALQK